MFFYQFGLDKAKADLIWNEKTKSELRQAIEKEITLLKHELDCVTQDTFVSWNHTEFEVIIFFKLNKIFYFFKLCF